MRKVLLAVIPLLLMSIASVYAESHPPSPTPTILSQTQQNKTERQQTKSDNLQHGTDDFPIAVKIIGTASTNTEISKQTKKTDDNSLTNWLLVSFNFLLAIFTYCLYRSTEKLWKAGEKQMHITRDSLTLAREEFISTHRPRLIVRSVTIKPHTHPMIPIEDGKPIQVEWCIVNIGDTPAEIIESNATILVGDKTFDARTPYSSARDSMNGIKFVPGGAFTFTMLADQVDFHNPGQLHSLTLGKKIIFFFGFVMYRDDIGNVRRTAFCRRYDPHAERFIIVNDPDYEYAD